MSDHSAHPDHTQPATQQPAGLADTRTMKRIENLRNRAMFYYCVAPALPLIVGVNMTAKNSTTEVAKGPICLSAVWLASFLIIGTAVMAKYRRQLKNTTRVES